MLTKNQGLNNIMAAHASGHAMPTGSSLAEVSLIPRSGHYSHLLSILSQWRYGRMTHGSRWRRYRHKRALTPGLVWKHAQTIYLEKQWSNFVASEKPASELNQWQSDPGLLIYSHFPKHLTQTTAAGGYGSGRHHVTDHGEKTSTRVLQRNYKGKKEKGKKQQIL